LELGLHRAGAPGFDIDIRSEIYCCQVVASFGTGKTKNGDPTPVSGFLKFTSPPLAALRRPGRNFSILRNFLMEIQKNRDNPLA
jgi:hypothetical protein